MRLYHLPHEIVRDEAVQHAAQIVLFVVSQERFYTEQRVRREHTHWKNRGDERDAVCRACHIAIGESWSFERTRGIDESGRVSLGDRLRALLDVRDKGFNVFPFEHGHAAVARGEMRFIVCGVQLAAKDDPRDWFHLGPIVVGCGEE